MLSQVDGAAVFDASGTLRQLGVLLVASPASESEVDPFRGTRHTSARRYSFDDPTAILVVVSEQGPVTVLRAGQIIGRSPVVAGARRAPTLRRSRIALDLHGAEHDADRDYRRRPCRRSPRSPRSSASTDATGPAHTAIIQGERTLTWAELYERACRVAQAFGDAGVGSQDRVAFLDKNGIEHFEVFFGASLLNAVCVDVNWRLAAPEVEYIVNDSEAKVFVVGTRLRAGARHHRRQPVERRHDRRDRRPRHGTSRSPTGSTATPPSIRVRRARSTTWRSSSTRRAPPGGPKGVMLTNTNFFGLLPVAKEIWELSPDAVNLVAMPLFHIGGGGWATAGMYEGCTSVIVRELDPAALVGMFGEHGITHAFLVPVALQFMLMVPGVEDADFSSLRIIVYGASPISDDVLARSIEVFKCKFWQAYGMTESTGTVVNLPPEDHDLNGPNTHRLRSCGVAGPGCRAAHRRRRRHDGHRDRCPDRRGRRDLGSLATGDEGLLEPAGGDGTGDHPRGLAAHGRRRIPR